MYPNQECSGNGKPVILPRCEAECECFGGWEGEYCERISANGGGDPHLETLDGKKQQFCLVISQSIDRSIDQSVNQSINQSINQSTIKKSIYKSVNRSPDKEAGNGLKTSNKSLVD